MVSKNKPATSFRKIFPPRLLNVEKGHGRIEWRGIAAREVTPAQMGFPHVAQVARIDRIRELKGGRQEVETVWIITSLTAAQADLARLLELGRQYWSIENGTHYPLDVSAGEDRYRVHQPVAATVLGIFSVENEPPDRNHRPLHLPSNSTLEQPCRTAAWFRIQLVQPRYLGYKGSA